MQKETITFETGETVEVESSSTTDIEKQREEALRKQAEQAVTINKAQLETCLKENAVNYSALILAMQRNGLRSLEMKQFLLLPVCLKDFYLFMG